MAEFSDEIVRAKRGIGMGRGLAAILPAGSEESEYRELPVELIKPNPEQPRTRFDPEALAALAESIRAAGVVQPLIVRPLADGSYELVAGERRWRAAGEAGLQRVPALIRSESDADRLQTALIENMVREDLNPVEEARACATLVEDLGVSKQELGRRLGRSRPAISNLIRLLELPDQVLELLVSGELSEGHGRAILQVRGNDARRDLAKQAAGAGWSVRETERRAKAAESGRGAKTAKVTPHPDQEAALRRGADALSEALGSEVEVRAARNGIRAELHFEDLDELLAFARRAGARRAA